MSFPDHLDIEPRNFEFPLYSQQNGRAFSIFCHIYRKIFVLLSNERRHWSSTKASYSFSDSQTSPFRHHCHTPPFLLSLMQKLTDRRPPLTAVRIYIHGGENRSSGQWLFCGFFPSLSSLVMAPFVSLFDRRHLSGEGGEKGGCRKGEGAEISGAEIVESRIFLAAEIPFSQKSSLL